MNPSENDDIQAVFKAIESKRLEMEEYFARLIDIDPPESDRCRICGKELAFDREASIAVSLQHRERRLVFQECAKCQIEQDLQNRLVRWGVPDRVLSATFENYEIYDPRQPTALASVQTWLRDLETVFLLLLGKSGSGKGHLTAAAMRALKPRRAEWIGHKGFITHCHALSFADQEKYLKELERRDLLVFDEMGGKSMTADTPEKFYELLDQRFDKKRKTILIGNIPVRGNTAPGILDFIGAERMESRLACSGIVVPCYWDDFRAREVQRDSENT